MYLELNTCSPFFHSYFFTSLPEVPYYIHRSLRYTYINTWPSQAQLQGPPHSSPFFLRYFKAKGFPLESGCRVMSFSWEGRWEGPTEERWNCVHDWTREKVSGWEERRQVRKGGRGGGQLLLSLLRCLGNYLNRVRHQTAARARLIATGMNVVVLSGPRTWGIFSAVCFVITNACNAGKTDIRPLLGPTINEFHFLPHALMGQCHEMVIWDKALEC
jgi:hypothetical protein